MYDPHAALLAEFRSREGQHCGAHCEPCRAGGTASPPANGMALRRRRAGASQEASSPAGFLLDVWLGSECPSASLWVADLVRARRSQVAVLDAYASPTNCDLVGLLTIATEQPFYRSADGTGWEVVPGTGTTGGVTADGEPPGEDDAVLTVKDKTAARLLLQYQLEYWLRGAPTAIGMSHLAGANRVAYTRQSYDLVRRSGGTFRVDNQHWDLLHETPLREHCSAHLEPVARLGTSTTGTRIASTEKLLARTGPNSAVTFEFDETRVGGPGGDKTDFRIEIGLPGDTPAHDFADSVQKVGRASLRGDYRWANLETYWAEIAAQYVYALAACIGDYPNCESDYFRTESFEVAFALAEPTGRRVSRVLREWYGTLGGA